MSYLVTLFNIGASFLHIQNFIKKAASVSKGRFAFG